MKKKTSANLHVCVDKTPPGEALLYSLYHASVERPDNMDSIQDKLNESQVVRHALRTARIYRSIDALLELGVYGNPEALKIAVDVGKKWANGRTLRVRFIGGSELLRLKVIRYAQEWERFVNLRFFFVETGPAEIRIAFTPNIGSWSYLGTDALLITNQNEATMNFGWFNEQTKEEEFSRTIFHEFGHAIGCIHEHQHPKNKIPWNKEAAYTFYAQQGWSRAEVDQQVFAHYEKSSTNYSAYDKTSIMHYPIPPELLKNKKYAVGWNVWLSAVDIAFAKASYPKS